MSLFPVAHGGQHDPPGSNGQGGVQAGFSSFNAAAFLAQQQKPSSVDQQGLDGASITLNLASCFRKCMYCTAERHKLPSFIVIPVQAPSSEEPLTTICHPAARARMRARMKPLATPPNLLRHQCRLQKMLLTLRTAAPETSARRTGKLLHHVAFSDACS